MNSRVRKGIQKDYRNVQGEGATTLEEYIIKTRILLEKKTDGGDMTEVYKIMEVVNAEFHTLNPSSAEGH